MPGIPAFSKTQQYSYNANGDVASYTSGEGQLYRYSYNKNQQITQVLIDGLGMVNWYDYQWQQPQEQQLPTQSRESNPELLAAMQKKGRRR